MEEIKIPFSIELQQGIEKINQLENSLQELKKQTTGNREEINKLNQEIISNSKKANEAVLESAKSALQAKKATEERAKSERILNQTIEEKKKLEEQATASVANNTKATIAQGVAATGARSAMLALRAALTGFLGLAAAAAFAVMVKKWDDIRRAISGVTKEQELQNKIQKQVSRDALESYASEVSKLQILQKVITDGSLSRERRNASVDEYNKIADKSNQIDKSTIDNSSLIESAISRQIELIKKRALAIAAENVIAEKAEAFFLKEIEIEEKYYRQSERARTEVIDKAIKHINEKAKELGIANVNARELFAQSLLPDAALEDMAKQDEKFKILTDDGTKSYLKGLSDRVKAIDKARKSTADGLKANWDERNELEKEFNTATNSLMKLITDADPVINPKKLKEKKSEYMQILESFIRQKRDAEVQAISDETDRAFKAEEVRFEQEKQAIRKRVLEFKGSAKERASLVAQADATIEKLNEAHLAKWGAISLKALEEEVKKEEAANKLIAGIRKKDLEQQIKDIEAKYVEINTKIAAGGKLTTEIEKELLDAQAKEIDAINQKHTLDALKKDEQLALARIGAMELQGKNEKAVVKLREAMKLQVMIDAAYERLDVLKKAGGVENELIIAQTEALINELQGKLSKGFKPKDELDIFGLLGIKIGEKDKRDLLRNFDTILGSISTIFEKNLQRQIDAKDRQIDILSDQVNKVQRELDKELALQEKGSTNNVEAKRAELEAISAERNKAQEEQDALYKRQAELAAAQIALDGLVQASTLALAAANIFKANSGLPFGLGVITAIAAIATMMSTFAAVKAQIAEVSSSVPKFRDGGEFVLDGPSHERGGLGVYNERTGKRVAEVEGGEGFLAINKKSTQKHKGLLHAINNDNFKDFANFSASLDEILSHADISIMPDHEEISKVVVIAQQNADRKIEYNNAMLHFAQNAHILDDIAKSNKKMLEIEKGKGQVIDMGDYYIVKTGNVTRRIKKRHAI